MQSVIASQREVDKQAGIRPEAGMEFEAFVLNEMCQFTGAFCNSLHCDEMDIFAGALLAWNCTEW